LSRCEASRACCAAMDRAPTVGAGAVAEADTLKGIFGTNQNEFQRKTLLALLPDVPGDVVPEDLNRLLRFRIAELTRDGIDDLLRAVLAHRNTSRPPSGHRRNSMSPSPPLRRFQRTARRSWPVRRHDQDRFNSSILTGGSSFRAGQSVIRPLSSPVWALLMLSIDPNPLIKRGSNPEAARQRRDRGPQGPGAGAARRAPDGHGHRGGLGCRQRPGHRPAREIEAPEPRKSLRVNIPQIMTYRTA